MFMIHVYSFALLAFRVLLCQTANIPPKDGSLLNPPTPSTNETTTASPSNDIQIRCGGRQFGTNLDYDSCLDALHTFTKRDSPVPIEIGRRNTGTYSHTLPWKWVSGQNSVKRTLYIRHRHERPDSIRNNNRTRNRARSAATRKRMCARPRKAGRSRIWHRCVFAMTIALSSPNKDVRANNTFPLLSKGQEGKLGIFMRSYDPSHIECGSTTQRYTANDKCAELLSTIPAEISPTISWGPTGKHLPYIWQLQGKACRLMLWGAYGRHELSDTMSSYEIWTAGVMLAGRCARFNKPGKFPHL
ncbi:MAG: hypothetical protein Q9199_006580, partial [Rusavskia elegans]